jgi:putative ABC transport system permease protein
MVVLQVALSLMLLVASGLLIKSFSRLRGVEPGYRVENLLTASIHLPDEGYEEGEQQLRFFEELRERVGELPGVEGVALINRLPVLHVWGNYPFWAPERPPEGSARTADRRVVLPGYFATMEIPVVEGRVFDQGDVEGSPQVIILNESAARVAYPDEGAVGRQVMADFGRKGIGQFEIVGVVKDHRHTSLAEEVTRPAMFLPMAQFPLDGMSLAVATSVSPYSLVRPVQERLWELDRDLALADPQSMAEALADSISDSRSIAVILSLFAWVAMALAVLGLYGVLAFFVNQRVHEIGVRVALGASVSEVLGLVIRRGLLLVSGGLLAGIGGALLATRLIEGMLFQISATHPGTYGTVAGTFTLVALAACLVPAWRALRVDPVEAFRSG